MTTAERAAAPLLPIPARELGAPGQFALADARRVRHVLEHSGGDRVDIQLVDVACALLERELIAYLTRLGPLSQTLADLDALTRSHVMEAVRPAFRPYVDGERSG